MTGFSDDPKTQWLTVPSPDRDMKLLEDFWFIDRQGKKWLAPAGSEIDGASIPQALWTTVGSPYTGDYRRASIVHDIACDNAKTADDRAAADRMFYEACRAGGCSVEEATELYIGVRIGAAWGGQAATPLAKAITPTGHAVARPRVERTPVDRRVEADYQITANAVLAQSVPDDPAEIERRVNEALQGVGALPPTGK